MATVPGVLSTSGTMHILSLTVIVSAPRKTT